jgi:hypothetical protein
LVTKLVVVLLGTVTDMNPIRFTKKSYCLNPVEEVLVLGVCPGDLHIVHTIPPIPKSLEKELLIIIHFAFKDHLLKSFLTGKKLSFMGGSLAGGRNVRRRNRARGTSGQKSEVRVKIPISKSQITKKFKIPIFQY